MLFYYLDEELGECELIILRASVMFSELVAKHITDNYYDRFKYITNALSKNRRQ
jgi:hypothetical protein